MLSQCVGYHSLSLCLHVGLSFISIYLLYNNSQYSISISAVLLVNLVHQIEKVLFNLLIIIIVQLLTASLHVNTNYSLHFTKMNKYI